MPRRPRKQRAPDEEETRLARMPEDPATEREEREEAVPLMTATEARRERELEDVLDEVGSDGRVRVWHVSEGRSTYAGEMSMEGFSLDVVMDVFGGGDKTLAFYQGKRRVDSVRVSLDPSVPVRNPRNRAATAGANPAAPVAPAQNFDMAAAMMTGMGAIMKASADSTTLMMTAIAEMNKSRAPERDPLEAIAKIAEIFKPTAAPAPVAGPTATELFAVFEKGMSVASKLNGGDEDATAGIIKEGIGAVGKIAEAIVTSRGQAPPVEAPPAPPDAHQLELPVAASTTPGTPTPPPSPPSMASPFQPSRSWHRAVLSEYENLKLAARWMSGDTAAMEVLRRLNDDDVLDDLLDDLDTPGFIDRTRVAFPDLTLSPEWVAQFHETLKANVEEEGEEEEPHTTVKAPGVAGHIAPG